jgi:hypothetical protein
MPILIVGVKNETMPTLGLGITYPRWVTCTPSDEGSSISTTSDEAIVPVEYVNMPQTSSQNLPVQVGVTHYLWHISQVP